MVHLVGTLVDFRIMMAVIHRACFVVISLDFTREAAENPRLAQEQAARTEKTKGCQDMLQKVGFFLTKGKPVSQFQGYVP